jgi:peptidoglycan hydrolase-like protein with peptidoglycan-binding domain
MLEGMTTPDETATKAATENLPDKKTKNSVSRTRATPEVPPVPEIVKSPKRLTASGADTDEVRASALDLNTKARKSLSVHHLQARLADLGYVEAESGLDGQFDALTRSALAAWQTDNKFPVGPLNHIQIMSLFTGDDNVIVVLDTPDV